MAELGKLLSFNQYFGSGFRIHVDTEKYIFFSRKICSFILVLKKPGSESRSGSNLTYNAGSGSVLRSIRIQNTAVLIVPVLQGPASLLILFAALGL